MATFPTDSVEVFGQGVIKAEGVCIDKQNNVYGGGRDGNMYKVTPDGKVSVLATLPAGAMPNGVAMDLSGNLIYCDLGLHGMIKVTPDGKVSTLADRVAGVALNFPNFATYDAAGNLFIANSSSKYNIEDIFTELAAPGPNGALVCLRANGKGEVVATDLYLANGTAIDPKEEAVYVLQSTRHDCVRIAIKKDGTFGKPELYVKLPAIPDGMCFDTAGNLYITLPGLFKNGELAPVNGLVKVDPSGNLTTLIDDPAGQKLNIPTNCAFGGPGLQDLYIANVEGDHFSRIHTTVHGHPLYHQR